MCMWFGYNPWINFVHFVNFVIFWPHILWKCIDSGYLVSATCYIISILSSCNFAHLFSMVWRCTCGLDLILQLILVTFFHFVIFGIFHFFCRCDINFTKVRSIFLNQHDPLTIGLRQANLVLIAYASSEGSGEPVHLCSLARTFAARSYKQWVKRNLQAESQIPGPSEWLGMRS